MLAGRKNAELDRRNYTAPTEFLQQQNHQPRKHIMKTKFTRTLLSLALAVSAGVFVTSCAEMGSGNTTSLLTAAGFRARTPQTPKQQELYAGLPPYKVEHATVKGRAFYVYKDEKAGVAYVGHEPEYQRYRQLAVQQQIAQNYYMAAEMDRAAAFGWYGAWGPRGMWW